MLLYLDTLKKDVLPKKEREMSLHFNLIQLWLCLWFATLFLGWRRDGRRTCLSGLCFSSHKHTYSLSLFTCCWACSCFCMDHPVTIVCKQCGGDEADSRRAYGNIYVYIYLKEYFLLLCWGLGGTLALYCVSFCHWLHQQSTEETEN